MSDLVPSKSITITNLLDNLESVKTNPSAIQRVVLDYLAEVVDGKVNIVDPTNPFVFLLEASSVNTAVSINQSIVNLRKQYPSLSQTEEDLYLHMSDKDYIGRFATPSGTNFTFIINLTDINNKMFYFFYGTDKDKARAKMNAVLSGAQKKRPDAEVFRVDAEKFTEGDLDGFLGGMGLFEKKYIVVLENIFEKKEIAEAANPEEKWKEKEAEYAEMFANPYRAAERGFVDDVILPEETRAKLIAAFHMLENKAESLPQKKHGNIPL